MVMATVCVLILVCLEFWLRGREDVYLVVMLKRHDLPLGLSLMGQRLMKRLVKLPGGWLVSSWW